MLDLEDQLLDVDISPSLNTSHEQSFNDPHIQKLLAERNVDPNDPAELERLSKIVMLLKTSKKYRRMLVESANLKWESSMDSMNSMNSDSDHESSSDSSIKGKRSRPRVRFSDSHEVITIAPVIKTSMFEQLKSASKKFKNLF